MLGKVVELVAEGKFTEARKIVREELDNRRASMLSEGKAYIASSISAGEKDKKKDPKKPDDGSHDGGAD
ncbi:hypothetical protein VPHK469_0007 [Vibrio phage K469]